MKNSTRQTRNSVRTAPARRVLLTSIASLLAAHAGFAADAAFSSGAFTNDSDSGVLSTKTYTAIANIIGGNVPVNGANSLPVTFIGSGGDLFGAGWDLAGTPNNIGGGGNRTTTFGGSNTIDDLFDGFQYGGNPGVLTMSGLTIGRTYVATLYNEAWELPANRVMTVTSSEGAGTVFNQDAVEASVLRYTFVATASTTVLNFAPLVPATTMHFYGLSNEQVFSGNTWSPTSGNDWNTPANWSTAAQNGVGTNATFSAQASPTNVNVDSPTTVGHVEILGTFGHTFSGANTLTFQADAGGSSVVKADAGSHTISAPVQFNTALAKFGAGSLRLTGPVAGSGKGITVGSGALVFETGTGNLSSVGKITNDGALSFINAAAQSYDGVISGTGSLTKSGAGTLTLNGVSTYSGSTTVSQGTLLLGGTSFLVGLLNPGFENTGSLGGGGWAYAPTGADWSFNGAGISSNGQPWVNTAPEGTHAGFIQGTSISQAVTFGSGARFDIAFQAANRPGHNPTGLILQIDGVTVSSLPASGFQNGGAFQEYRFADVPISAGTHTITFLANNTFGGDVATAIDAISIASTVGTLPSGTALNITTSGASVDLNGHNQTIGSLAGVAGTTVQNIGAFKVGGDGSTTTFSGIISGPGSFTKAGGGVMTLNAAQAYGGSTTISGGGVQLVGGSLPANTTLNLTGATSILDLGGTSHVFGSIAGVAGSSLVAGGASITTGNDNTSTLFAGSLTGAGDFTKEGAGKQTLAGPINYSGNTTVYGGTLRLESANTGSSGLLAVDSGAAVDLTTANHSYNGLVGSGTITRSGVLTTGADGAALLDSNFNKNYLLKLDFGDNGGATVNGVAFATVGTTGTGFNLTGAGNLFGGPDTGGYDQLVNDFLYGGNPGTLTFSDLTPGQTYNATLYTKVGHWAGRPQNATFDEDPAGPVATQLLGTEPGNVGYYAYQFVAHSTSMSINMAPQIGHTFHWFAASLEGISTVTPTLTIGDSGNYGFGGAINGPTKLIKQGSGIQHLSGASNYSGGTDITGGVIFSHNATGLGSGPVSVANGSNVIEWFNTGAPLIKNSFTLNGLGGDAGDGLKDAIYADGGGGGFGEYTITGDITLNATSNIGGHNTNNLRLAGPITGAGGLTKGAGRGDENNTLILASNANAYAGNTVITVGTMKLGAAEVIPHGAGKGTVVMSAGATLDLGGFNETINNLSGSGSIVTTASASIGAAVFFTDDAGTGISGAKTYTHALDFVDAGPVTINTVPFTSAGTAGTTGPSNEFAWSLTGAGATAGNGATGATGNISTLLTSFYYNGNPATLTLTGLTPGVTYETHLYQRQWGGDRTQFFTVQSGPATGAGIFNEDASATPSYLPIRYTVDGTGTAAITTYQIGDGTYHWFGLTNEVVAAPDMPVLTVGDATSSLYSGAITGELEIEKVGAGTLTLDGSLDFNTLTANEGKVVIQTSATLDELNIADGAIVELSSPAFFAAGAQAVPEPGSIALLLGGVLALMGRRRRNA